MNQLTQKIILVKMKIILLYILLFLLTGTMTIYAQGSCQTVTLGASASISRSGPATVSLIKNLEFSATDIKEKGKFIISPVTGKNTAVVAATGPPGTAGFIRYYYHNRYPGPFDKKATFFITGNPAYDQLSSENISTGKVFIMDSSGKYYFWIGGEIPEDLTRVNGKYGKLTIEIDYQ